MTAGKYDLEIEIGADFEIWVQWKSNGAGVDMSGGSAKAQIRSEDGEVYYTFDTALANNSATWSPANQGKVRLFIPASSTKDFSFNGAVWDIFMTKTDGRRKRLLYGQVCRVETYTEI